MIIIVTQLLNLPNLRYQEALCMCFWGLGTKDSTARTLMYESPLCCNRKPKKRGSICVWLTLSDTDTYMLRVQIQPLKLDLILVYAYGEYEAAEWFGIASEEEGTLDRLCIRAFDSLRVGFIQCISQCYHPRVSAVLSALRYFNRRSHTYKKILTFPERWSLGKRAK